MSKKTVTHAHKNHVKSKLINKSCEDKVCGITRCISCYHE